MGFVLLERSSFHSVSMRSSARSLLITLREVEQEVTLGLLLLRVRDELKMTIAAYQTLYQSSVTFGMRK